MRLYLSSFRVGDHPERLLAMAGSGRKTALVPNALDGAPAHARAGALARDAGELTELGLDVTEVDLWSPGCGAILPNFDLVWVRGGNTFVLRRALADTGMDDVLRSLIARDSVVYGSYSAGGCVLAPSLAGLERVDDVAAVDRPIMTGLSVLDRPFVPHIRSPGHPETSDCDAVSAAYTAEGQAHWALRDGQVLVVDGDVTELL